MCTLCFILQKVLTVVNVTYMYSVFLFKWVLTATTGTLLIIVADGNV